MQDFIIISSLICSNMTLPVTVDCLENKLKKDPKIVRFMCPLGATSNMDGTVLYEGMIVIFFVQQRGKDLGFEELRTLALVFIYTLISCIRLYKYVVRLFLTLI